MMPLAQFPYLRITPGGFGVVAAQTDLSAQGVACLLHIRQFGRFLRNRVFRPCVKGTALRAKRNPVPATGTQLMRKRCGGELAEAKRHVPDQQDVIVEPKTRVVSPHGVDTYSRLLHTQQNAGISEDRIFRRCVESEIRRNCVVPLRRRAAYELVPAAVSAVCVDVVLQVPVSTKRMPLTGIRFVEGGKALAAPGPAMPRKGEVSAEDNGQQAEEKSFHHRERGENSFASRLVKYTVGEACIEAGSCS